MKALQVLWQAPGFVAADKPSGAVAIPARMASAARSLREMLEEQLGRRLFVVHRLDRDTSGVILFALSPAAHRALSMAFESGRIEKQYLALVRGQLDGPMEIDIPLASARRGRTRRAGPGESGKAALTRIRPLERFRTATLIEARPLTGRTHQIRVHLLEAGYPLLVDPQYRQASQLLGSELGGASGEVILARTPLHAQRLRIPALAGIEPCDIESPLPPDMARALELLRGDLRVHPKGIG